MRRLTLRVNSIHDLSFYFYFYFLSVSYVMSSVYFIQMLIWRGFSRQYFFFFFLFWLLVAVIRERVVSESRSMSKSLYYDVTGGKEPVPRPFKWGKVLRLVLSDSKTPFFCNECGE